MGSTEIKVLKIFYWPVKKATENPYPRRGQIRDKLFEGISQSIERILPSIKLSLMDDGGARGMGCPKKKVTGNPFPQRGRIKHKIFKDLFRWFDHGRWPNSKHGW